MSRRVRRTVTALVVAALAAVVVPLGPATPAPAQQPSALECAGDLGDPVPGTLQWTLADLNNRLCAAEGLRMFQRNPAIAAAQEANASAGQGHFLGDPFRAPPRWSGRRGTYQLTTYTDRNGAPRSAALFGPPDDVRGPYPGIVLACHVCALFPTAEHFSAWYWAAQSLAEAGYVVMYADIAGNSVPTAADATDFFVATPDAPTARGEFNPWHARVDRNRLGIAGHSGAAIVALTLGHADPRFDAIVAWDPAPIGGLEGMTLRTPTMVQVAEYDLFEGPVPRPERPTPEPGSKYTFADTIRAAGVDAMQVALRASTHLEWHHFPSDASRPHSVYGEGVAMYYTRAWFDRYLGGSRGEVRQAQRRLTTTGERRFDRSVDGQTIGAGYFDPARAESAGSVEGGNVPVTISGVPVRNLLSFQYDSRYWLDGGASSCDDMRAGCPP